MAVETRLCTLRHAQTDFSREKRYAGSMDIPLSDAGIEDCRAASRALAASKFDVVITSDLRRAIQTAHLLGCAGAESIQTPLCRERRFGIMEGHTYDDVHALDPPVLFVEVNGDRHSVNPEGGEFFEDLWARAKRFKRFVFRAYRGKSVLVVSHGVFLQMFHGVLRGSNCIESLGAYPATLEMNCFQLVGNRLAGEQVISLTHGCLPRF